MTTPETNLSDFEKAERLREFFDGTKPERAYSDLTIGATPEAMHQREAARIEAALSEFDNLLSDDEHAAKPESTPAPDGEPDFERIDHAPVATPYDRARQRIEDAEILCATAEPGSGDYHEAMADLAEAKRALKLEQDRATDDGWRKRRVTDEWRAGPGRDEYNASRRKTRSKPNKMTPKGVLDAMTPEQRERHKADMAAKDVWVFKRRKAGWTEERIEAELPGWWARRTAKRACP